MLGGAPLIEFIGPPLPQHPPLPCIGGAIEGGITCPFIPPLVRGGGAPDDLPVHPIGAPPIGAPPFGAPNEEELSPKDSNESNDVSPIT